ncbi:MAG: ABC transporter substrate-binding protein, partial [Spirochaetota bacterium]
MRNKMFFKTALVLVMLVAVVFSVTAQGQQDGEQPIKVGHLTYHTGPWADVGPWFDGMTEFAIDVVNENPPLGRKLTVSHQDIGPGEAQAAKKLIEREQVDILLNPGHGYLSYRDWILDYIEANDAPLMPSVVGGGIEGWIGGTAEEPIFRASPMDTTQAT